MTFSRVHPPTNLVPASPSFIFGTFDGPLARHYFQQRHLGGIGVFAARGFEVFGPYALYKDGHLYASPESNLHPAHVQELVSRLGPPEFPRLRRFVSGQAALITGPGYPVYGHWLSDFLPKLYLLHASGHDIRRLTYIVPADIPAFGLAWLELLGIPAANIHTHNADQEVVWVEELLVPTTIHNGVRASVVLRDAADFLAPLLGLEAADRVAQPRRRLFISRAQAPQGRPLENRQRIEEKAAAAGLEIVHPQTLSLIEQVHLFRQAGLIIGEYGSALHGTLFSRRGTIVCALRGSLPHPGFIQSGFGHALRQPTGYVFGRTLDSNEGFEIADDDFSACLDTVLGANGFE